MSTTFKNVLVVGGSRGVGLGLVQELLPISEHVYVSTRDASKAKDLKSLLSDKLSILECDLSDDNKLQVFVNNMQHDLKGGALDLVIMTAGVKSDETIENFDLKSFDDVFKVNVFNTCEVARNMIPFLEKSDRKQLVFISSKYGSIETVRSPCFIYNTSKAAVNMLARSFHTLLNPKGFIVQTIHPGWVKSEMGGDKAPVEIKESAEGIINLVSKASPDQDLQLQSFDGQIIPW